MKGSRSDYSTQRAKILAELVCARGDWVPLYRVTQHAAQHSWFRLEPGSPEPTTAPAGTTPAENLSSFVEGEQP
jgi:hypothetical protein